MKVFYNNSIAKALLAKGYSTIMLFGCILTKYTKEQMSEVVEMHERVHHDQYIEIRNFTLFCSLLWTTVHYNAGGSVMWYPVWIILSYLMFYLLYASEWVIKAIIWFLFYKKKGIKIKSVYYALSFEREAYYYQNLDRRVEDYRPLFGWILRLLW